MLATVSNSQTYTNVDQIINSLKILNQRVLSERYPLTRCELQYEIDFIITGLINSKEKGCLK